MLTAKEKETFEKIKKNASRLATADIIKIWDKITRLPSAPLEREGLSAEREGLYFELWWRLKESQKIALISSDRTSPAIFRSLSGGFASFIWDTECKKNKGYVPSKLFAALSQKELFKLEFIQKIWDQIGPIDRIRIMTDQMQSFTGDFIIKTFENFYSKFTQNDFEYKDFARMPIGKYLPKNDLKKVNGFFEKIVSENLSKPDALFLTKKKDIKAERKQDFIKELLMGHLVSADFVMNNWKKIPTEIREQILKSRLFYSLLGGVPHLDYILPWDFLEKSWRKGLLTNGEKAIIADKKIMPPEFIREFWNRMDTKLKEIVFLNPHHHTSRKCVETLVELWEGSRKDVKAILCNSLRTDFDLQRNYFRTELIMALWPKLSDGQKERFKEAVPEKLYRLGLITVEKPKQGLREEIATNVQEFLGERQGR